MVFGRASVLETIWVDFVSRIVDSLADLKRLNKSILLDLQHWCVIGRLFISRRRLCFRLIHVIYHFNPQVIINGLECISSGVNGL